MKVKQLSVFLENKTGRLNDVTKILAKANINMRAFSVADSSDFGILRMLVDDTEKAKEELRNNGFAVSVTDIIGIKMANKPGTLNKILDILAEAKVYIEYMYAYSDSDKAITAIKPDDMEKAVKVISDNNIDIL
ncbi:MAG: ACT domain-containing protein [Paludibacteraceae bacterium]|nr:ACT domain-containing protein [Paludibacteraceae bacterium]